MMAPAQRVDGKCKRKIQNWKALMFKDFSRARIEKHYSIAL
jgi:hypothetical protein